MTSVDKVNEWLAELIKKNIDKEKINNQVEIVTI